MTSSYSTRQGVRDELTKAIEEQLATYTTLMEKRLRFNKAFKEKELDYLVQ